jgi:hypothetical protein
MVGFGFYRSYMEIGIEQTVLESVAYRTWVFCCLSSKRKKKWGFAGDVAIISTICESDKDLRVPDADKGLPVLEKRRLGTEPSQVFWFVSS